VKALKLLLEDLRVGGDAAALNAQRHDLASDDGVSSLAISYVNAHTMIMLSEFRMGRLR
jgi:hypothetical protein